MDAFTSIVPEMNKNYTADNKGFSHARLSFAFESK